MDKSVEAALADLTPTEFENLTYDALKSVGVKNLVWRTPGADGGRDIEGHFYLVDPTGFEQTQTWYIECKRYAATVDWPTVWKKIAYSDVNQADIFLLSTNSNPSPDCETEIARWNNGRRKPAIRVWRGYEWRQLLATFPDVAIAYGLGDKREPHDAVRPIATMLTKTVQAAYLAHELSKGGGAALELSAALAELITKRLSEVDRVGRFIDAVQTVAADSYEWLRLESGAQWDGSGWDEVSVRAVLTYLRYFFDADELLISDFSQSGLKGACLRPSARNLPSRNDQELKIVEQWSRLHLRISLDSGSFQVNKYE